MAQVSTSLAVCDQTHSEKCRPHPGQNRRSPTRLIDVSGTSPVFSWPPRPEHRFRLVETNSENVERYVTLSHCWDKRNFARLLVDNIQESKAQGICWSELCTNANFRDVVEVAHRLHVRYVWIDSLCIIQDRGHQDWEHEAPLIHMVYRNPYCKITASASADSDGGLFRDRVWKYIELARHPTDGIIHTGSMAGAWRIAPEDLWDKDLGQVLYTRGWVFQGIPSISKGAAVG